MTRSRPQRSAPSTRAIDFQLGAFHLSEFRVPYLSTLMRIDEAAEYLNLVTDDARYAQQDWTLAELFQREVDQGRVNDMVRNYLSDQARRPQFFNSLTVVLRAHSTLLRDTVAPVLDGSEYRHVVTVGPVSLGFFDWQPSEEEPFPPPEVFGRVAWNPKQVYAVAIDGQHRLAAIKKYVKEHSHGLGAHRTTVSVLLLIFDPAAGFQAPAEFEHTITAMRSIFIDLNKHAVKVSRARNLLLDDLSPSAVCLRSLLGQSLQLQLLSDQSTPQPGLLPWVGSNGEFVRRLPLDLIDWHGEAKSKIEQGPYLSSVLALDWIIQRVLGRWSKIETLPSPDDVPDSEEYYEELELVLRMWRSTYASHFAHRLQECKSADRPFFLRVEEVAAVGEEFSALWARPLVRLLTTLLPYREVVEARMGAETVGPQFGQWYQALAAEQSSQRAAPSVQSVYKERRELIEEELKESGVLVSRFRQAVENIENIKNGDLFFYLVGQRALVKAFLAVVGDDPINLAAATGADLGPFAGDANDFAAFYLVEALNHFARPSGRHSLGSVFRKSLQVDAIADGGQSAAIPTEFWAGALLKREDPTVIDFSDKAAERGANWLVLMAHLYWWWKGSPAIARRSPEDVAEHIVSMADDDPISQHVINAREAVRGNASGYTGPISFLLRPYLENGWHTGIANQLLRARLVPLVQRLKQQRG